MLRRRFGDLEESEEKEGNVSPICVKCERFMRPKKNDFKFIEAMEDGQPYKLWAGDKWACETCGVEVVVGVARQPIRQHYETDFAEQVTFHKPEIIVR